MPPPTDSPSFAGDSVVFDGFALRFDLLFAFAAGVSSRPLFRSLPNGDPATGELSIIDTTLCFSSSYTLSSNADFSSSACS
jgi:hypothetical protein